MYKKKEHCYKSFFERAKNENQRAYRYSWFQNDIELYILLVFLTIINYN
jgi:hypothetical protein